MGYGDNDHYNDHYNKKGEDHVTGSIDQFCEGINTEPIRFHKNASVLNVVCSSLSSQRRISATAS